MKVDDMIKDEGFMKFLYKNYEREERIKKAKENIKCMINDMKSMTGDACRKKWGKPERVFSKLKWELYKAKNDIIDCDKCKSWHHMDDDCNARTKPISDKQGSVCSSKCI